MAFNKGLPYPFSIYLNIDDYLLKDWRGSILDAMNKHLIPVLHLQANKAILFLFRNGLMNATKIIRCFLKWFWG